MTTQGEIAIGVSIGIVVGYFVKNSLRAVAALAEQKAYAEFGPQHPLPWWRLWLSYMGVGSL